MRRSLFLIPIPALLSLACTLTGALASTPEGQASPVSTIEAVAESPASDPLPFAGKPGLPCGKGVCDGPENSQNCPADCSPNGAAPMSAGSQTGQEFRVTNPSSGASLYVHLTTPDGAGCGRLPAVVLVPGGSGDSAQFRTPRGEAAILSQAGYLVVTFDPDGRGQSQGQEDYNGHIQQDGLAEVIRFTASQQGVDPSKIGLVTYSYGITMGAGALARHPDLPVKFLIDWEGPANRDDTGGCDGAGLGHLKQVTSCADEAFWSQREASTFIGQIRVPYQRIQSEKDHVQPDNNHAIRMLNNAVAGGVPWVRLNDLIPNQTFDTTNPPAMLPEDQSRALPQLTLKYLDALFEL